MIIVSSWLIDLWDRISLLVQALNRLTLLIGLVVKILIIGGKSLSSPSLRS